ncbi:hypothetical protein COOONC_08836 [Cooperia oncophora]
MCLSCYTHLPHSYLKNYVGVVLGCTVTSLVRMFAFKLFVEEMTSCRVLECVRTFLRRVDLLPLEESARMGLVNQLMLYVENAARALILYVQHASEPLPSEKGSATKSSRFSLNECRRALDMQSDSWFHACSRKG